MKKFRLLISGGRKLTNYDERSFATYLDYWLEDNGWHEPGEYRLVLVHGDCPKGIDSFAKSYAKECEIEQELYTVTERDYKQYGRLAPLYRNTNMVLSKPDYGLIFPGGNGTKDMMVKLFKYGIPFEFVGGKP